MTIASRLHSPPSSRRVLSLPSAFTAALGATLALASLWAPVARASPQLVVPGAAWTDASGARIQAHGGGILKVGSTYYWIGEDKTNGSAFQNVKCYASTDLVHWTFKQNLLTRQSSGDLGPSRVLERPKLIYNDSTRQYVMYMHIDSSDYGDARAGVATSGSSGPCDAPYNYLGSVRPLGNMARDMTLFKDTDGQAYLAASANNNADMVIYRLSSDYLSVSQEVYRLAGQSREAPAIFKVNGVYFMVTSGTSGWSPNMQRYMSAMSLAGPWSSQTDLTPSSSTSYDSQTAFVLPVTDGWDTTYVYVGDRWFSDNLADSRYVWVPLTVNPGARTLAASWYDSWTVDTATGVWQPGPLPQASTLTVRHSGKVAQVRTSSAANAAPVLQATSVGAPSQLWSFVDVGSGYYHVINRNSGKCLDVNGQSTDDGGTVIQYPCATGQNQQWKMVDQGNGYFELVARHSGKCLDVKDQSTADGTVVDQWTCNAGTNQQWQQK
jgi:hypothetical protein